MNFPHPFTPDMATRAGRMMAAGRCKVTMVNQANVPQTHVTILFQSVADNRDRTAFPDVNKNWVDCQLADATHVFAEVPTPSGQWNDKIGTYYPKSRDGRWYDADNADPQRVRAAFLCAAWLEGQTSPPNLKFMESTECGVCGLELTDPVSVERGIGPTCYGRLTGSKHATKWTGGNLEQQVFEATPEAVRDDDGRVEVDHAHKYHSQEDPEESYEDLGLPSAAENAAYGLLKGMSESQLEALVEWSQLRLEQVVQMRRLLVAEGRAALPSDSGMEAHSPGADSLDQSFMAR